MGASQVEETNAQSQKLYTCEHCQMTFLRPVHLERHMRNVHSQEQESECKVCHKLFQNKYYLSVHMLTHAMDKELECPLCKKRFPDLDSLNKHKDAHLGLGMNNPANNNAPYMPGTNPQLNNQIGARNVTNPAASTAGSVPTTSTYTGANRGNTLNCDLRLTDLNSLNRSTRNYRGGQPAVQNTMRQMAPNKNSTVSCDLRLGDINSLNRNATSSIRLPQKRPSNDDHDVIVTGVSSLKRPFRGQGHSGANTNPSRNQPSIYGTPRFPTANKTPASSIPQLSSRNSFLQNQLRAQNSLSAQRPPVNNSMTNRNVTDRIFLTSEGGVSSQSTVRNSLPARISYSNRKQLANHLTQNNRFGNNSIYSNLSHQRNQLLRNSGQANQRSVVNCDLTRGNLGAANRHPGLPYNNAGQQFSNGTKESDSTVNCDLTISNISSLSKNQWPTHSTSNSHSAPSRNYGLSTRPVSTVNFDLTTADINVLKRNRRLRQAGRMFGPSTSTVGQASSSTLNCDLSVANLASMEKNRHALNNSNRFGRLNPNMIASRNSQQTQNTVNCDLTTNNLNDWNRRNTICYRANNQPMLGQNRQPTRTLNCNLTNVNLSSLNQRVVNSMVGGQSNQPNQPPQVRPVQVYANSAALQRQKNAAALSNSNNNSNFGVQGANNAALRARALQRRTAGVGPPASALSSINRSRMSRMIRQRKTLAQSNVPVINLDPEDDVPVVSKSTTRPTNSTNIVQFDLTGPDVNVTTYENGGNSFANKKSSGNLVDIVELGTSKNSTSQPVSNNASSVVEFDLSNTSIQAFSTGQNERASTCTINLDGDNWASNSRNVTTDNNASSDVTLLEVRSRNKPAEGASQTVPDITLSNVRSLSTVQSSVPEDERTAVSGITLVDIRSLSTSEIDANFQNTANDSGKSQTKVSSEQGSSSVRSLAPANSRSTDDMPTPTVVLDNVGVDHCTIAVDNAEATVVTETDSTSANEATDKMELKEDYFTCKTCLEQIHHLCNYISHLKSHDSKEFCKCYYCDSVFGNIQELVVHSVVHVGDLKKQCVFCREVLAPGEDPITHMTGCGEFQCIMFESGTRVKIEKSYQKDEEAESEAQDGKAKSEAQNQDQDVKAESAAQNQDQDEKAESVAQNQDQDEKAESVAQNQVDQDEKAKSVDQNQVDQDEKAKSMDQNQVDQDGDAERVAQNQVNQMDQEGLEERDQSAVMQERKEEDNSIGKENSEETDEEADKTEEMTKDDGLSDATEMGSIDGEETKEAEKADGDESEKANEDEDKSLNEKSESPCLEEAEKSDRDVAEMSDKEGTEMSDKEEAEKSELEYQSNAKDDDDQSVDQINLKVADRNEKEESEEDKIEDKKEESTEEMEQENTATLEGEHIEPMEQENSEKTGLESSGLTEEEKVSAMDLNETEQTEEKTEESGSDKKDDSPTSWCEWEKSLVIKSEKADRVVTKVGVKFDTEMEGECRKEIEFEVDINKIKQEINNSNETLEGSKQIV